MKQKKQNRILAALLAVVMMFQMLPMMAFAAEGAGSEGAPSDVTLKSTGKSYSNLKDAVKDAKDTDTIQLGEGKYSLYGISSDGTTKGKDLTFVGRGHEKTVWYIGANAPDSGEDASVYAGDDSFDGVDKVTFQDMTLRTGDANYLGFKSTKNTVVKDCVLYGRTTYWGYQSAEFIGSVFNAPNHSYALWVYSSAKATFEGCTFNASGRVINIYNEGYTPTVDVYFNNCTVKSEGSGKAALNINDIKANKYTIHVTGNNDITATTDTISCSKVFGFSSSRGNNNGHTDVYLNDELVWTNGQKLNHAYTDGEKEGKFTVTRGAWDMTKTPPERDVTTTCDYCGYTTKGVEKGYKLAYDLNGGTKPDDAAADEYDTKLRGTSDALAKAPVLEGYQFLGWKSSEDSSVYPAGKKISEITNLPQTGNITLTAQWEEITTPGGGSSGDGGSGDGGAGVVVAGALLGGAGYLLGTRLWLESTFGFVPANRIELAMALWKRADCPAPVSTELYPDIDEDDTDAQAAARWCVEQDLMKDFARTNSDGTQTVKFKPYDYVFRPQSLVKWYKLEKLLNEQQSTNA